MKKLMVVLAAVALAGAAQAASLTWSILNMQAAGVESGWLVALYDSSTTFDYAQAKAGTLTPLYSAAAYTTGTAIRGGQSGVGSYSAGDSVSAYAVIFNAATVDAATQYMVSEVRSATVGSAGGNITLAFGNMAATTSANSFRSSTFTPTSALPEPTSGLLMLVGLGALALRRRRA